MRRKQGQLGKSFQGNKLLTAENKLMMKRCRKEETTAEHIHRGTLKCLPGQSCTAGPSSERLSQLHPSCSVPAGAEITDMDFSETR